MPDAEQFILGEHRRTLDDRYRLSIPSAMAEGIVERGNACVLAKERPGCLSLWNAAEWQARLDQGVALVQAKMRAGKLEGQKRQVQMLGRLLSTRHCEVQLSGRGRLLVPEGFREFLQVEPGGEVMVVGAAICVEIWHPRRWIAYLDRRIGRFGRLFDQLSS